ncbi:hypothetical protein JW872_00500 [Candidatus Babeliales bacterium]|nr:hypothetical protein [Candidatus Babeliales bacterium]
MATIVKQAAQSKNIVQAHRSYEDIIHFLDTNWHTKTSHSLDAIRQLDALLDYPSRAQHTILISGTNGKSLTAHFLTSLLHEEGITAGIYTAPHIHTYNERLSLRNEHISNELFTQFGNSILTIAEHEKINLSSSELLTLMALLYCKHAGVDVAVLEVATYDADPTFVCTPQIMAITRLTETSEIHQQQTAQIMQTLTRALSKDSWVVSADQSKLNLQIMADCIQQHGCNWAMPIRKLTALPYPFEQLHGRAAALAERIAHLYVTNFVLPHETIVNESLLVKPKGHRGRPTLEAKRNSELNPRRSLTNFWQETATPPTGRFQIIEQEHPTVLLDNASNLDALKNLLLGIRLLHYQRPIKGLALIMGCHADTLEREEFLKVIRYFFKKTSGHIIFYPVAPETRDSRGTKISWNVEQITNSVKNMKMKARASKSFEDAFSYAIKHADERNGLIVISGSNMALREYWNYRTARDA